MPYQCNTRLVPYQCLCQVCAISMPRQCHANAMPVSWWCHANAMSEPSAMPMPYPCQVGPVSAISSLCASCQCHAHARSQCHVSLPSLVPCQCNANAMSMPRQCHVSAMSMPCQCRVMPRHCADGSHNSRGALPQTESGLGIALSNVHQQHYQSY